jgi:hypothetical protein
LVKHTKAYFVVYSQKKKAAHGGLPNGMLVTSDFLAPLSGSIRSALRRPAESVWPFACCHHRSEGGWRYRPSALVRDSDFSRRLRGSCCFDSASGIRGPVQFEQKSLWLLGPAYKDVAKKYAAPDAETKKYLEGKSPLEYLKIKVREGTKIGKNKHWIKDEKTGRPFGMMTPNPKGRISDEDLTKLLEYILSLK